MDTTVIQLKELMCPICCDTFKTPKILQCGHTFCQQCLHELFQSPQHVCCPVCKEKVVKNSNNLAETLPTNYALKVLVEGDTYLYNIDSISRSFGECPTHTETRDQFCRTCERQLCKQCVNDNHEAPDHDTSSVLAVVVQQTEVTEKLARELNEAAEKLKRIEEKIAASERTCETEAEQLAEEINSSVAQSSQNISDQADSLQNAIQENKKELLKYRENLRLEYSELSLSATEAIDLCQSLQMDLHQNNLSRVAVIERLNYKNKKIKKRLLKLEENENVLNLGLRFQSLTQEPTVGKFIRSTSLIPVARHLRKFSLYQRYYAKPSLRGFVWPFTYWMIGVKEEKTGKHNFVEFFNINFFIKDYFTHEIGIEDSWFYVSNSDYSGKYILCLAEGKVQKFILPSTQNEQKAGKVLGVAFLSTSVNAISWDEKQKGCYALLQDRKTLLHLEFEGQNGHRSDREVAVLEEEIATSIGTHVLHVNGEGSMAICDHEAKAVHFFKKVGTEPTISVKAPPDLRNASPECVNTRKWDKSWYVLWKLLTNERYFYCLAVYDSSFEFLGCVEGLTITPTYRENDKAMFCFQEEYLAVVANKEVALHGFH